MPPIVQTNLGADMKKKQSPEELDIVRSSFQTLDNNRNTEE